LRKEKKKNKWHRMEMPPRFGCSSKEVSATPGERQSARTLVGERGVWAPRWRQAKKGHTEKERVRSLKQRKYSQKARKRSYEGKRNPEGTAE